MLIDAHHHVWQLARGDYGWLTSDLPIFRDYTLADLRPLLGDITATVLVQAAPTEGETAFMLEVARNSAGLVRGVVGWQDFLGRDAPDRIASAANDPLLKGLRPMLQDIADTGWILRDEVQPALHAMVGAGLRLDALVQPRHLPVLAILCQRHPDLPVVIDHGAKPAIATRDWRQWAADIRQVAQETGAYCKLSGLITEAGANWVLDDLRYCVDHLLTCFGADRLMWGSDWPVVDLAGGYPVWRAASVELLTGLSPDERSSIFGGAAAEFYGLATVETPNG